MHPPPPTWRRCAPRPRKAGMSCRSLLFRSGNFAVKSPPRSALSTPTTGCAQRGKIPRDRHHHSRERADPLHRPAGGRGLCVPGDGAGDRLAPAADRRRFRHQRGRSLDCRRGLCREPRLDPAHHRPGRRPFRQISHRRRDVCARLGPGGAVRHRAIAFGARRRALCLRRGRGLDRSMAYVGDVTPYARRQAILARYLSGQITGHLFGQAAGGVLGDLFGWRNVFFVLAGMFALATAGLILELLINPRTRAAHHSDEVSRGFVADYAAVLSNPWARFVILAVFIEASVGWGAFAYVGADLHLRFGLNFGAIGLIVGTFGVGGLLYAASVSLL